MIVPLANSELVALIDDEDADRVLGSSWRLRVIHGNNYAIAYVPEMYAELGQRSTMLHRLILRPPKWQRVDHRNGDGLDNRRENLRIVTNTQNLQNSVSRRGTSQYKGVSWIKRRGVWSAQIRYDGKNRFIGHYTDEVTAARAYDREAQMHFGEFARLNFPAEGG